MFSILGIADLPNDALAHRDDTLAEFVTDWGDDLKVLLNEFPQRTTRKVVHSFPRLFWEQTLQSEQTAKYYAQIFCEGT